jgi:hypothetical protein
MSAFPLGPRFAFGSATRGRLRPRPLTRFAAIQLVVWASVYGLYLAARGFTIGSSQQALANAWDVIHLECAVGMFGEAGLQHAMDSVAALFSTYYMLGFGPLVGIVVVWLGLRHRDAYRELRNALLLSIALATIVYAFFPTAPPRLVGGLGIEDSVGLSSHDAGSFLGIRFNPYAAVPSMHVGWALLVGVYGFRNTRSRLLRSGFVLHPFLMAVAVTATGNHFFLDSVAGLAVAGLTLALLLMVHRGRRALPGSGPGVSLSALGSRLRPSSAGLERRAA